MALQDRDTLRNYFRQGTIPQEVHFHDLIDSVVNKVADVYPPIITVGIPNTIVPP
jgi:hypothetical protein